MLSFCWLFCREDISNFLESFIQNKVLYDKPEMKNSNSNILLDSMMEYGW